MYETILKINNLKLYTNSLFTIIFYFYLDPTPRWPPCRDSPDFRPYNSLPRGQDVSEYPSLARNQKHSPVPKTEPSQPPTAKDEVDEAQNKPDEEIPRQRRISLFERTLSELYDTGGKRSKKKETTEKEKKEENKEKQEINDKPNKHQEPKPTKIPSPKRKIHTARSDTATLVSKKETFKKFSSLQNDKKSLSGDKNEKHVSFEHVEVEVTVKSPFKSGIPRRDPKTNEHSKKEDMEEVKGDEDSVEKTESSASSEIHFAQIETINEEDVEVENISGALFRKVTVKKRRHDLKKAQAFDEGKFINFIFIIMLCYYVNARKYFYNIIQSPPIIK